MFERLKKIFSGNGESVNIVEDVSVKYLTSEKIISELKLKNSGQREGHKGNPSTSSNSLDQHEKDIERKFDENRKENKEKISEALDKNSTSLINLKEIIDFPKKEYEQVPTEAKEKLHIQNYEREEKKIKEKIKIFDSNVSIFKHNNDRVEEAHYTGSFIFHYAILFVLFIGETVVNGQFFGPNVAGGLIQGITIAAFISIINVGLSIFGGSLIFPETNHIDKAKKFSGYVGMFLLISILFISCEKMI